MTLSLSWLTHLLFISIRLGTVLLFTPIQAIRQLPIHTRFMFLFILSIVLLNYLSDTLSLSDENLVLGGLAEFSNGLILATSLYAAFGVFQVAGQLIDNQTGLNSVVVFDPSQHSQESLTSHLLSLLAVLFFFNMDGHLWLFKSLAYSFLIIPPGHLALLGGFELIIKQFVFMFNIALMIAGPIVLILLGIDLAAAMITRNMPQMNSYFLIIPIKILLGLSLLALSLNYLTPLFNQVLEQCFHTWGVLLS